MAETLLASLYLSMTMLTFALALIYSMADIDDWFVWLLFGSACGLLWPAYWFVIIVFFIARMANG